MKHTTLRPRSRSSGGIAAGALACLAAARRHGGLLAGRAYGGRRREPPRELHVEPGRRRPLQLRELVVQPLVLAGEALAAPLQDLAVHLRLLQLCSGRFAQHTIAGSEHARVRNAKKKSKDISSRCSLSLCICWHTPCSPVLEPHFYLSRA